MRDGNGQGRGKSWVGIGRGEMSLGFGARCSIVDYHFSLLKFVNTFKEMEPMHFWLKKNDDILFSQEIQIIIRGCEKIWKAQELVWTNSICLTLQVSVFCLLENTGCHCLHFLFWHYLMRIYGFMTYCKSLPWDKDTLAEPLLLASHSGPQQL